MKRFFFWVLVGGIVGILAVGVTQWGASRALRSTEEAMVVDAGWVAFGACSALSEEIFKEYMGLPKPSKERARQLAVLATLVASSQGRRMDAERVRSDFLQWCEQRAQEECDAERFEKLVTKSRAQCVCGRE